MNINLSAQQTIKARLIFKGIQNTAGGWQLNFDNKKKQSYRFNAQRSNTTPYVFYSTGVDGSLKENEKVRGSWFFISYTISKSGKPAEKIITHVEITTSKLNRIF